MTMPVPGTLVLFAHEAGTFPAIVIQVVGDDAAILQLFLPWPPSIRGGNIITANLGTGVGTFALPDPPIYAPPTP